MKPLSNGLLEADAWLTLPAEADVVLSVDRHRQVLGAVVGALLGLGYERPHLSAGDLEAIVGCGLTPDLALTEGVAVALVVVAGGAGGEEVGFDVTGEFEGSGVAFEEATDAALTAGEVQFAGVCLCRARVRGGVERRVDIGVQRALTVNTFKREEGDRSDGHSLVAHGEGVIQLIGDGLLGVAEGLGEADVGRS